MRERLLLVHNPWCNARIAKVKEKKKEEGYLC